jgi:hypothetical protein
MQIGDYFEQDVTRDIPPVVYFHEQGPAELKREVDEYIITGGYPVDDSRAAPDGIHEQFVRLLTHMKTEQSKPGGPELPACWISGFYGSGKSSFAKLLGLALDGRRLPDGKFLADALLARDRSPAAGEFRKAWDDLTGGLDALAVVFDVGAKARDAEHIHSVIVRQVQERLDYCPTSHLVAEYELKLELEGVWKAFEAKVREVHGKSWEQLRSHQLAEDYFSAALHALQPSLYPDATAWVNSRAGSAFEGKKAADEAVVAIQRMLETRARGRTLFLVLDEVSQYVHDDDGRMLALQSFVAALGQRLRGRAWILATGQQKLEEGAGGAGSIVKMKARFPPQLRVHLGESNIREVVHQRLLRKKKVLEPDLRELYQAHRAELSLHAYEGERILEGDFVEVYPLLPGHIDLLLRITSGLRARGSRVQGDAHEIRGLLQLLGDIFRQQDLARREPGWLLTLDRVYDVLHTALDADLHLTLNRAMDFCGRKDDATMKRVVKAVAMLELVQDDKHPTTAELVARCLYDKLGSGNPLPDVQRALDTLVAEGLVGQSRETGYRIESSAGQEWQRQRDAYVPTSDQVSAEVQRVLKEDVLGDIDPIKLEGLPLAWLALYSDSSDAKEVRLLDERTPTVLTVDMQMKKDREAEDWIPASDTQVYRDRIVWVAGPQDSVLHQAKKLVRSHRMVDQAEKKHSTDAERQRLLVQERNDEDNARRELAEAVKAAFLAGRFYFRGTQTVAQEEGTTFAAALVGAAKRIAPKLYPNPVGFSVSEKELLYLIESPDLAAPPAVFGADKLGVLALDAGRYEVTCTGRVPQDILAHVKAEGAVSGASLLAKFGGTPHGVPPDVIRAAVVGLLRGRKIRVELPGVPPISSVRDEGVRELLKDGGLRKANLTENTTGILEPRDKVSICALFKDQLHKDVAREPDAIADAVAERFPLVRQRLTALGERFRRLPKGTAYPPALRKLEEAVEACRKDRNTEPTMRALKRSLHDLREGLSLLRRMETDLDDEALTVLATAAEVLTYEWPGLEALGPSERARTAADAIRVHLTTERPWEDVVSLVEPTAVVRSEYRERRSGILTHHDEALDAILARLKRRPDLNALSADQRHKVLQHVHDGAANTDEKAIAPPVELLEVQLAARRQAGEEKALLELDGFGPRPTVEVPVGLVGRELETVAELDRLLDDLRERVLRELARNHRVRLKGS